MAQEWTEGRLDELSCKVDNGFERVEADMRARFERVEADMRAGFERVDADMRAGFERVDADMRALRSETSAVRSEMAAMQRTMVQGFIAITGGMLAGFAVLGGLIATQL